MQDSFTVDDTAQDKEDDTSEDKAESVTEETDDKSVQDAVDTKTEAEQSQTEEKMSKSKNDVGENKQQDESSNEKIPPVEDNEVKEETKEESGRAEEKPEESKGENSDNVEKESVTIISSVTGEQMPISSISAGTSKPGEGPDTRESKKPEKLELKNTPIPAPVNLAALDSGNLTERLEKALGSVAPLLREIFVDFAPYLSKTLIGSHGQELLIGGKFLVHDHRQPDKSHFLFARCF